MRKKTLNQLTTFNSEVFFLKQDSENYFQELQRADRRYPVLLQQYNRQTLAWLADWGRSFQDAVERPLSAERIIETRRRKSLELRAFFYLRYHFLPFGIVDITQSPFLFSHRALLLAAQMMVAEDESVCQIMMPWVERIIGSAVETDIKTATEEANGEFKPWRLVAANQNRNTLISVMDYLDYVRNNNEIARAFLSSPYPKFLERIFDKPFKNYVRALEYFYRRATLDPSCFAYHIYRLAISLHERSVSRHGSEFSAASKHNEVIAEFYHVWNALPPLEKNALSHLRLSEDRLTLKDYLLVVFSTTPDVQLSEEDLALEQKNHFIHCADILSGIFLAFMRQHIETWSSLRVHSQPAAVTSICYTQAQLNELRSLLLQKLDDPAARWFINNNAVLEASTEKYESNHREFFSTAALLPQLHVDAFAYFFRDYKTLFESSHHLFSFFAALKDKEYCTHFWIISQERFKTLFVSINDIIMLTHFLDEHSIPSVLETFKDIIYKHYQPGAFLHPENARLTFVFMMHVIREFPDFINNLTVFAQCIFNCRSEEELDAFFLQMQSRLFDLFSPDYQFYGDRWVGFLDILESRLQGNVFARHNKNMIYKMCFEWILPLFLRKEQIIGNYWEQSCETCCCFFSSGNTNKNDTALYDRLLTSYQYRQREKREMSIERMHDIVANVKQFLEENKGGAFLKILRKSFHPNFFKRTQDALQSTRPQWEPVSVVSLSR